MSKNPLKTLYTVSTPEAVEAALELKRVTELYCIRERALRAEFNSQVEALAHEGRNEQSVMFEALRAEMGIPDEDWNDGDDWAVSLENLAKGLVALVHMSDSSPPTGAHGDDADECSCVLCQLRRYLAGPDRSSADQDSPVTH